MKPMDKIRRLSRRNLSGLTYLQIGERAGVSKVAVSKFMNGGGSPRIATYLAMRYGGKFTEFLAQYERELFASRKTNQVIRTFKPTGLPIPDPDMYKMPGPSRFVPMPHQAKETHHMPELDGGLTAYWLPVL